MKIQRENPSLKMTVAARSIVPLFAVLFVGCQDLVSTRSIPSGVTDPAEFQTAKAANEMVVRTRAEFQRAFERSIVLSGLLSDEFSYIASNSYSENTVDGKLEIDRRLTPELINSENRFASDVYNLLHKVRGYSINTRSALQKYDSTDHSEKLSELFSMQGYAEILLADLFCSGVPLSTIVFENDYAYAKSSTTEEVYLHAVAIFDSALLVSQEGSPLAKLAQLGEARALLAIGKYQDASAAVKGVDVSYKYQFKSRFPGDGTLNPTSSLENLSVSNREGISGYPFHATDRRTEIYTATPSQNNPSLVRTLPGKYRNSDVRAVDVVVANGIEASLIIAEAELMSDNGLRAMGIMNDLRASISMGNIVDPGDKAGRLSVLLDERAAWLFATAHRQGDLRRFIRSYGMSQTDIYPHGIFQDTYLSYGTYTNVAIPRTERANPNFRGCLDRNA